MAALLPLVLMISACVIVVPSIAKLPEGERLQAVQASSQYRDGQFQNEVATPMRTSGGFSVLTAMIGVDLSCATVLRLSHLCQP
jgi:hypothetical protein